MAVNWVPPPFGLELDAQLFSFSRFSFSHFSHGLAYVASFSEPYSQVELLKFRYCNLRTSSSKSLMLQLSRDK